MKRLLLLALFSSAALAQTKPVDPKGLDELLKQVQQSAQQSSKLNTEREQRFLKNKAEQANAVAKAEAEMAAAQSRVSSVKARFDANQKAMADLKQTLATRAGEYSQGYAAVKAAAGDFRAVASGTLVGAQYPDRLKALDQLAQQREVPSIAALEQFWFIVQQEMTESGKTARFKTGILDSSGVAQDVEVTRIGNFTAFAGQDYLALGADGRLEALTRQPKDDYLSLLDDFSKASEGRADILVDPSRGSLLLLETERPGWMERLHQGEEIGYIIIAIGVLGFVCAIYQMVYLFVVSLKVKSQLKDVKNPRDNNPLGRVLRALGDARAPNPNSDATDAEVLELRLSEAVLREQPRLERFQGLLKLIVAAGPLLGLVGTVGGMIITFQVITELGAGDPKAMARGISQAMIATLLGLGEAIPLLFINAYLASRSKALVQILDEQSAGLLARQLEARRVG